MMLGKRGDIMVLPFVILAIVFLMIATLFVRNYVMAGNESKEVEACRLSVLRNSELRAGRLMEAATGMDKNIIPSHELAAIDCPKRQLEIGDKKVAKYADPAMGAKYEIASKMRLCWYQWGRGQLSPFEESFFDTGSRYCAICYEVSFEDRFSQSNPRLDNFLDFLVKNYVPDGSVRFINYLTNTNYTWDITPEVRSQISDSIDTSKPYAILYTMEKKGTLQASLTGSVGAAGGGLIGCKVGSLFAPIAPGISTVIGCGVGFVGGGIGGYLLGSSTLTGDSAVRLVPEDYVREQGCRLLFQ